MGNIGHLAQIMKVPIHSPNSDAIEKLQVEINRLQDSQKIMRNANAALRNGDDSALRSMGFSEEHIADLKERYFSGRVGFPDYAFRNNSSNIRSLKKCMQGLRAHKTNV